MVCCLRRRCDNATCGQPPDALAAPFTCKYMSYLRTNRDPAWVVGSSAECNRALLPIVMAAIIDSKDLRRCARARRRPPRCTTRRDKQRTAF